MNVILVHSSILLQQMEGMLNICCFKTQILTQSADMTHAYCIYKKKKKIDLEYAHQLVINMRFEECSRCNKPFLKYPFHINVLT